MRCTEKIITLLLMKTYVKSISRSQEQQKEMDYFKVTKGLVEMQCAVYTEQKLSR